MTDKCIWNTGTPCSGNIEEAWMFQKQLLIPICENHLNDHRKILFLHSCGVNIEELFQNRMHELEDLYKEYKSKYPDKEEEI